MDPTPEPEETERDRYARIIRDALNTSPQIGMINTSVNYQPASSITADTIRETIENLRTAPIIPNTFDPVRRYPSMEFARDGSMTVLNSEGVEIVRIRDGRVWLAEDVSADQASREFWNCVQLRVQETAGWRPAYRAPVEFPAYNFEYSEIRANRNRILDDIRMRSTAYRENSIRYRDILSETIGRDWPSAPQVRSDIEDLPDME